MEKAGQPFSAASSAWCICNERIAAMQNGSLSVPRPSHSFGSFVFHLLPRCVDLEARRTSSRVGLFLSRDSPPPVRRLPLQPNPSSDACGGKIGDCYE